MGQMKASIRPINVICITFLQNRNQFFTVIPAFRRIGPIAVIRQAQFSALKQA